MNIRDIKIGMLKVLPKNSATNYAEVLQQTPGKFVITDGFKLLTYYNPSIDGNYIFSKNLLEVALKYPNCGRVQPTGSSETLSYDTVLLLRSFFQVLKKSKTPKKLVLEFKNEEVSLAGLSITGICFNPFLVLDFLKAIPKQYPLEEARLYKKEGLLTLKFGTGQDYFELLMTQVLYN